MLGNQGLVSESVARRHDDYLVVVAVFVDGVPSTLYQTVPLSLIVLFTPHLLVVLYSFLRQHVTAWNTGVLDIRGR